MSKQDNLYKDAMDTASTSNDPALVEDLLAFFITQDEKECFAAMLFTCYEYIKPDVVIELAWRHNLADFAMPFIIQVCVCAYFDLPWPPTPLTILSVVQFVREYATRLEALEKVTAPTEEDGEHEMTATGMMDTGMMALPAFAGQGSLGQPQGMMQPGMMQPGMMQPGMAQPGMAQMTVLVP